MCKLTRIYVLTYAHLHPKVGGPEIAQFLVAALRGGGRKQSIYMPLNYSVANKKVALSLATYDVGFSGMLCSFVTTLQDDYKR
jgi:hypothetical protein